MIHFSAKEGLAFTDKSAFIGTVGLLLLPGMRILRAKDWSKADAFPSHLDCAAGEVRCLLHPESATRVQEDGDLEVFNADVEGARGL
jgi:hypothetical protein